jgi:hypothetical protein
MKKTYLTEYRGAIRGNARLRRKFDAANARIGVLKSHIAAMATLADENNLGDHRVVRSAAAEVGWARMSQWEKDELIRQVKALHGETHAS